jgi:tellurium resistance protein TerD
MINLEKGQRISMDKGLTLVGVGLGWDPNEGTGYDFDLDASAFMLGDNGQVPKQEFFVFYGNQKSPDGSVESTGDDLTGRNRLQRNQLKRAFLIVSILQTFP